MPLGYTMEEVSNLVKRTILKIGECERIQWEMSVT